MTVLLYDAKEDFENMQGIVEEIFVVQDLVYANAHSLTHKPNVSV